MVKTKHFTQNKYYYTVLFVLSISDYKSPYLEGSEHLTTIGLKHECVSVCLSGATLLGFQICPRKYIFFIYCSSGFMVIINQRFHKGIFCDCSIIPQSVGEFVKFATNVRSDIKRVEINSTDDWSRN